MKTQRTIMLALVSAAFAAAYPARAASTINYNDADLLLNFRDSSLSDAFSGDGTGDDVTVDLGNINTFFSAVDALSGGKAVLDSGTGYATSAYAVQFTGANLITKVGTGTDSFLAGSAANIGFSAAAENLSASGNNADTLWLTRQITSAQLVSGGSLSPQQSLSAQVGTADIIQQIGQGASASPIGTGGTFTSTANQGAGAQADGNANSYYSLIQDGAGQVDYQAYQSASNPSALEATPSSGTVFEALWEVPLSGNGSDTYEGYFSFQQNGELDFTAAPASVPEPSTWAMLAGAGLIAVVLRRQRRSQTA
jgi:hypothetical protein